MSIGRVFNRAFATLRDNPVTMFGIALLFGALPGALLGWAMRSFTLQPGQVGSVALPIAIGVGGGLIALILAVLTQGALVRATVAFSEGRRATIGECAATGLRVALPMLGLGILLALGVGVGLVVFFVPGVMLFIMWSVSAPVLVEERSGVIGAFGRSRYLTKGARWSIFGLELVVVVFYWLISAALGIVMLTMNGPAGLARMAAQGYVLWYTLGNMLLQTIVSAVWGAIQTSLYVELRDWKDGPAADRVADIFA